MISTRARTAGFKRDLEESHDRTEVFDEPNPLFRLTRVTNQKNMSEALAWDDLTGMRLQADKVIEARSKEMKYVRDMKAWEKIPRSLAQAKGWNIIKTRWIDINKGDDDNPMYRSRLVGNEFNNESKDGIFVGTPPLEGLRNIVREAATLRGGEDTRFKIIMVDDVSRAFFEAPAADKSGGRQESG